MDIMEPEDNFIVASDAKLHGGMCRVLHPIVAKVMAIFPFIEASRPRSKSGIQALCSLHVALDRAKGPLQHCSDCSKIYLAITGDTVLLKFEKARNLLQEGLRRVEDIVTEDIRRQIIGIAQELEEAVFALDPAEKEAGDEVIDLLQRNGKLNNIDIGELEVFHQASLKLGITSSRAALTERRALKKLVERARAEKDKRKETVVSYIYNLMRKYSKIFRSEAGEDTDSQGSSPCSPTLSALDDAYSCYANGRAFSRQLSNMQSFNSRTGSFNSRLGSFNCRNRGLRTSENMPIPPEELRCPISLQLMYDPVIISSGQTYERVCIEKWFNDGHSTCPKTQQQLAHLCLTPNYCVKAMVASWCEQNDYPVPDSPPGSFDVHWRAGFSDSVGMGTVSVESIESPKVKGVKVVPLVEEQVEVTSGDIDDGSCYDVDAREGCENLLDVLYQSNNLPQQCRLVEQIRYLLKDDEQARIHMGANGFAEALVQFLRTAVYNGNEKAQEVGAMALFNLAVNNSRNKGLILSAGVINLLEEMISNPHLHEAATALYLNLSCLSEAKAVMVTSSRAVSFLVQRLYNTYTKTSSTAHDALYTLYNLSTDQPSIPSLLSAGVIDGLYYLLTQSSEPDGLYWSEKALAVLISLASTQAGRREILSVPGLVSTLAMLLDTGEPTEQEQAVACLLVMCNGDEKCIPAVLQEGVVPSLVSISVNGTARGQEKSQKLLRLFREHRLRDAAEPAQQGEAGAATRDAKPVCKLKSKKLTRTLSSLWRNRNFSLYQC